MTSFYAMKRPGVTHSPKWSISDLANKFGVTEGLIYKHYKNDPKAPTPIKIGTRLYFDLDVFTAWWETQVFVQPIKHVTTKVHRSLTGESTDG